MTFGTVLGIISVFFAGSTVLPAMYLVKECTDNIMNPKFAGMIRRSEASTEVKKSFSNLCISFLILGTVLAAITVLSLPIMPKNDFTEALPSLIFLGAAMLHREFKEQNTTSIPCTCAVLFILYMCVNDKLPAQIQYSRESTIVFVLCTLYAETVYYICTYRKAINKNKKELYSEQKSV